VFFSDDAASVNGRLVFFYKAPLLFALSIREVVIFNNLWSLRT